MTKPAVARPPALRLVEGRHAWVSEAMMCAQERLREGLKTPPRRGATQAVCEAMDGLAAELRGYVASEEEELLPTLMRRNHNSRTIATVLVREHRQLEAYMLELQTAATAALNGEHNGRRRPELRLAGTLLEAFRSLWCRHLAKERAILYPLAARVLGTPEWNHILARMVS